VLQAQTDLPFLLMDIKI